MRAFVLEDQQRSMTEWRLVEAHRYWRHWLFGPVVSGDWFAPSSGRTEELTFPLDVVAVLP